MSTTYYKFNGEILTAEEAAAAANAFAQSSLPNGYSFVHWSSQAQSDVEVEALNPGGAGVAITSNRNFYPVIILTPLITMEKSGNNVEWDATEFSQASSVVNQQAIDGTVLITNTQASIRRRVIACSNAISQAIIGGTYTGTDTGGGTATNPYVDFGIITLTATTTPQTAAFRIVSQVDGATYYLKIKYSSGTSGDIIFEVYKNISGTITKLNNFAILTQRLGA